MADEGPAPPLDELAAALDELRVAADEGRTLDALAASKRLEGGLLDSYDALVVRARDEGALWDHIGEALGISKQGARQRWHEHVAAERANRYDTGPRPPATTGARELQARPGRRR